MKFGELPQNYDRITVGCAICRWFAKQDCRWFAAQGLKRLFDVQNTIATKYDMTINVRKTMMLTFKIIKHENQKT